MLSSLNFSPCCQVTQHFPFANRFLSKKASRDVQYTILNDQKIFAAIILPSSKAALCKEQLAVYVWT
jgi:hypothetical protein